MLLRLVRTYLAPYAAPLAAVALRSLIFGASRPELGMTPALSADQIADLLLSGVATRGEK